MLPSALLIGLMTLPLLGVLVSTILSRIPQLHHLQSLAWLPRSIAAAMALAAAWVLSRQVMETVLGNWGPVSLTGAPLVVATYAPSIGILIAWATILVYDSVTSKLGLTSAMLFAALVITALANNFITLIIGIGLIDLLTIWQSVRSIRKGNGDDNARAAITAFLLNGVSLMLLVILVAIHLANGNSLYFPLARLPGLAVPLAALAIALRLGYLPFRASPFFLQDIRLSGSVIAGLLLLVRLPSLGVTPLPDWLFALAIAGAIVTLIMGTLAGGRHDERTAIQTGGLYLASASAALNDPGLTAASAIAWLLGCTLVNHAVLMPPSDAQRIARAAQAIGGLCLIGLPLTVGFIGRSGLIAFWIEHGLGGWLLALGFVVAVALLIHCLLRYSFPTFSGLTISSDSSTTDTDNRDTYVAAPATRLSTALDIVRLVLVLVPVIVFGIAPSLIDAGSLGQALVRNGVVGWLAWLISIAMGVALWWFESRWSPIVSHTRKRLMAVLELEWLYSLTGGAVARIRNPLGYVFTILESDGALLWALIAVLLIVLVSRPGGP